MQEINWQLCNAYPGENRPLPIYVDLDAWTYRLRKSTQMINIAAIRYKLAVASLEAYETSNEASDSLEFIEESAEFSEEQETDVNSARSSGTLSRLSELLEQKKIGLTKAESAVFLREISRFLKEKEPKDASHEELYQFLSILRRVLRRAIVFLLDEFDSLWQMPGIDDERSHLVLALYDQRNQLGSVVFAQNRERSETISRLLWSERKVQVVPETINFFDKDGVEKLTQLICRSVKDNYFPYSDLAFHFVWRLTGGWPALTQLLLYRIVSALSDSMQLLIDVSSIKRIVRDKLLSRNDQAFCSLVIESLTADALAVLINLCKFSAIDQYTSSISGISISKQGDIDIDPQFHDQTDAQSKTHWQQGLKCLWDNQIIEIPDALTEVAAPRLRAACFSPLPPSLSFLLLHLVSPPAPPPPTFFLYYITPRLGDAADPHSARLPPSTGRRSCRSAALHYLRPAGGSVCGRQGASGSALRQADELPRALGLLPPLIICSPWTKRSS